MITGPKRTKTWQKVSRSLTRIQRLQERMTKEFSMILAMLALLNAGPQQEDERKED